MANTQSTERWGLVAPDGKVLSRYLSETEANQNRNRMEGLVGVRLRVLPVLGTNTVVGNPNKKEQ